MKQFAVITQNPEGYDPQEDKPPHPVMVYSAIRVDDLKEYLDTTIKHWRLTRDNAEDSGELEVAIHYIDAFQSARSSILGETLL